MADSVIEARKATCFLQSEDCAYVPRARRFDSRISLATLIVLNAQIAVCPHMVFQMATMAVSLAAMLFCNRPRAAIRWTCAYLVVLGIVAVTKLPALSWLTAMSSMLVMFLRMFPAFAFAMNFISTTRTGDLACTLQKMNVPSRFIVAFCVALRFIPALGREFTAVLEAMKVRGIMTSPVAVMTHPLSIIEKIMVPIISRAGIIADELGNAAVARGTDTEKQRTSYRQLHIRMADIALIAIEAVLLTASLLMKAGVITW